MNKGNVLLFSLLLTLLIGLSNAHADYNFTCGRTCESVEIISCSNTSEEVQDVPNSNYNVSYYYENVLELNISRMSAFITVPDFVDTDLELETDCSINVWLRQNDSGGGAVTAACMNATYELRLLNGSDVSWTDYTCQNTSLILTNEEITAHDENDTMIFCTRGEIIDAEITLYDSTDGTCSGSVVQEYPIIQGAFLCDGEESLDFTGGADVRWRMQQYGVVTGSNETHIKDTSNTDYLTTTLKNTELYSYDVECDGTSYAFNINTTKDVFSACTYSSQAWTYTLMTQSTNVTWTECTNFTTSCSIWGSPTNATLTYNCECPPTQSDYGLLCDGDSCTRTCSDTEPENFIYNETVALEGTLQGALASEDSGEVLDYFTGGVISIFSGLSEARLLEWLFIGLFILFVLLILGFIFNVGRRK